MKLTLALCTALLIGQCSSTAPGSQPAPGTFTVRFGQSVTIPGTSTTITFFDVRDSRCPANVSCIWEGDAAVHLRSASGSIVLHTNSSAGSPRARLGDLDLTLEQLSPPAPDPNTSDREKYVATLRAESVGK